MIVPMKKAYIVCQAHDGAAAIAHLGELGVIHVEHQQPPHGQPVAALQEEVHLAASALEILSRGSSDQKTVHDSGHREADWRIASRHIIDLEKRLDQLQEYSRILALRIAEWERWGDFNPEDALALERKGIFVRLFEIPEKEVGSLPQDCICRVINAREGIANCLVISRVRRELAYKEVPLPKNSLSAMRRRLEQDAALENELKKDLAKHSAHRDSIAQQKQVLEKKLEFQQALAGMGRQGQLIYLAGYLPHDAVAEVTRAAQAQRWGISIQDPSEEDAVPTFLRIPRWAQKIKPVMALLGIVPGYRELDVSAVFLVFFSIFFGILIGDAGYGAAYVLLTFWAQKKIKAGPATAHIFPLLYLLSSCAILWGILTGSFFGQAWLVKYGIRPLVPRLNDPNNMQTFCFFLGAFHLSIAHAWRTILKLPALSALADVGWICVLWAAFFLARMLLLGATLPGYVQWLIVAGIGLVIFFTHPQRNLLKTVLEGLGTIALSLMNNFTDVVSYVRLFAVGMAGVAIAETTNSMAAGLNGVLFGAASVLIVLIGHGLNIVLGPMSVLVHGVRLNVLEFSGHAGVSWSGTEYQPLKS